MFLDDLLTRRTYIGLVFFNALTVIEHPSPLEHGFNEFWVLWNKRVVVRDCFENGPQGGDVSVECDLLVPCLVHMLKIVNIQLVVDVPRVFCFRRRLSG